jgi:hypothetical protein
MAFAPGREAAKWRRHRRMRKWALTQLAGHKTMEVERSNLIGSNLADLSHRSAELRGYL